MIEEYHGEEYDECVQHLEQKRETRRTEKQEQTQDYDTLSRDKKWNAMTDIIEQYQSSSIGELERNLTAEEYKTLFINFGSTWQSIAKLTIKSRNIQRYKKETTTCYYQMIKDNIKAITNDERDMYIHGAAYIYGLLYENKINLRS